MGREHQVPEQIEALKRSSEEVIDLADILRIFWKRKYFIIGGFFLSILAALIIAFNMTKIFRLDTVLEPGILNISTEGGNENKRTYIDSVQNLKALIDVGTFNDEILKRLRQAPDSGEIPKKINFKTSIPENSNALKVWYETADTKQGFLILNYLNSLLIKKYSKLIKFYEKEYDSQIQLKGSETSEITRQKSAVQNEISVAKISYEKKLSEINTDISKLLTSVEKVRNDISATELEYSGATKQNNSAISKIDTQIQNVNNDISNTEIQYGGKIKTNALKIQKIANQIIKVKTDISNEQSETEAVLKQKANKIDTINANIEAKKNQIKSLQRRTTDIEAEIDRVNKNTDFLIEERNKLLSNTQKGRDALSSVMYINTIQQNIAYLDNLKNRITTVNNQIFQERAGIEALLNGIQDLEIEKDNLTKQSIYRIDNLKAQIDNLENEIKDLEGQSDDLSSEKSLKIELLRSRVNNFKNDIKALGEKISDLLKEKKLKIEQLEYQINNLESDVNKLKRDKDILKKEEESQIETLFAKIKHLDAQIKYISDEIAVLEFKRDNIGNIQILKPPGGRPELIKPKKKLIVFITVVMSIFILLCASLILEFVSKKNSAFPKSKN